MPSTRVRPIEERFWEKVDKNGPKVPHMRSRCWLWMASTQSGYGAFAVTHTRIVRAHRVAWELAGKGPIPEGMNICHQCDVTRCVRPDHLFIGTRRDNMQDAYRKNRIKLYDRRNPLHRHPELAAHGETHYIAKLTDSDVREIRRLAGTISQVAMAQRFDVSRTAIASIVQGRNWKHV